eukprot:Opistho-1_new@672
MLCRKIQVAKPSTSALRIDVRELVEFGLRRRRVWDSRSDETLSNSASPLSAPSPSAGSTASPSVVSCSLDLSVIRFPRVMLRCSFAFAAASICSVRRTMLLNSNAKSLTLCRNSFRRDFSAAAAGMPKNCTVFVARTITRRWTAFKMATRRAASSRKGGSRSPYCDPVGCIAMRFTALWHCRSDPSSDAMSASMASTSPFTERCTCSSSSYRPQASGLASRTTDTTRSSRVDLPATSHVSDSRERMSMPKPSARPRLVPSFRKFPIDSTADRTVRSEDDSHNSASAFFRSISRRAMASSASVKSSMKLHTFSRAGNSDMSASAIRYSSAAPSASPGASACAACIAAISSAAHVLCVDT